MADLKPITLNLKHGVSVDYVLKKTGQWISSVIINKKITLTLDRIYYIPVTDHELSMDDAYIIKPKGEFNEKLDIRNVNNGFAVVRPLVANVILHDGDTIGWIV